MTARSRVPLALLLCGLMSAAPPPQGQTNTTSYTVDGIRVIHRRSAGNNIVAANLYLLGGSRQLTAENAGIELLLLDASERGTRNYPKEVLRRKMSRLGTAIVTSASPDWSMFGIRSTTAEFDSTWAIFSDRLMHPRLLAPEVEIVRTQFLSAIAQRRDDPDGLVRYLADSIAFAGHPYAVPFGGTQRSISSITAEALHAYQRANIVKSRMLLVVVGDITREKLESLIRGSLARLPAGTYRWTTPPPAPSAGSVVLFEQRPLPTNYILGYYAGPVSNDRDLQALRIATSVLSGRMFAEIRTRQNLTYDVHAPFVERAVSLGGLYVSTASPDATLRIMRSQVRELQQELLDPVGLNRLAAQFVTEYLLDNETNAEQADFLARAELYQGDYRKAERFVQDLRNVTPEEVRSVAQRYMRGIRFAYIGDSTRVDRRLLTGF